MQLWLPYVGLVAAAFVATLLVTPLVRRLALRWGLVDRPDATRKMHVREVPLGGGVAVLAGTLIALAAACFVPQWWEGAILAGRRSLAGLGVAVIILCAVGLVDDAKGLRARQKLAGQLLAAMALMASGLVIQGIQFFEWPLDLGLLAWPVTLFWFLGAINSVNLLDGADGLATTVGIVLTGTVAGIALLTGHSLEALIALALMGSLLAFLVFNRPPASIFLGDAGSMFIGLVAGALAIRCCVKSHATFALAAPIAIWAVPAFDSAMAVVRRKLTGRSLATTDRGHLHHCLQRQGFGHAQLLLGIGALCLVNAAGALLSVYYRNEVFALASILIVVAVLVATRVFGHAELLLVTARFRALGLSLVTPSWRADAVPLASSVQLQGSHDWQSLWDAMLDHAADLKLTHAGLNIDLPWIQESFHASWSREERRRGGPAWQAEIPLLADGRLVGRLVLTGEGDDSVGERFADVAGLIRLVEGQLASVARAAQPASAAPRKLEAPPAVVFGAQQPTHAKV